MNAQTEEPNIRGVPVRPSWALALYALLVVTAGLAFYAQRTPGVDPNVVRAAPWLFLVFAIGFAAYRIALVASRRYSLFKAFIQVTLASLFFLLLLFPRTQQVPQARSDESLLQYSDSRVRAMAAENIGFHGDVTQARALISLLADSDESVRAAAHEALIRLNGGADLGIEAPPWEARFP
jgi:hypothetical protein